MQLLFFFRIDTDFKKESKNKLPLHIKFANDNLNIEILNKISVIFFILCIFKVIYNYSPKCFKCLKFEYICPTNFKLVLYCIKVVIFYFNTNSPIKKTLLLL